MNALIYVMVHTLKNKILLLKKKPALLILYLLIILSGVAMVMFYFSGLNSNNSNGYADIRILYAIVAAVGLLFAYIFVNVGLSTGGTLFTMADVSLLFVSPISSRRILFYGLIKQMGTALLTSIFIAYQLPNLERAFPVKGIMVAGLFLIYGIIIFFCQLLSMAIYIFSNGKPHRKRLVLVFFLCILAVVGAVVLVQYSRSGSIIKALMEAVGSTVFGFTPVIGWAVMFIKAIVEQNLLFIILSLGLFIVSTILLIAYFTAGNADYYEDVLLSTEYNFTKLQAAKEGRTLRNTKKLKVDKEDTGLRKGKGASAIFYKQVVELRRESKWVFIDKYTILAAAGAGIACYFQKSSYMGLVILGILVYLLFIFNIRGRLSLELMKPYIYLVPVKSINKLLAATGTSLLKPFIDGLIIFTVVAIVLKTNPLENLFLAFAYGASGSIFVSFTVLFQRFFGAHPNKILSAFFGIGLFTVLVVPAIVLVIAGVFLLPPALTFMAALPYIIWSLLITALVFLICGNIFETGEFSGKM